MSSSHSLSRKKSSARSLGRRKSKTTSDELTIKNWPEDKPIKCPLCIANHKTFDTPGIRKILGVQEYFIHLEFGHKIKKPYLRCILTERALTSTLTGDPNPQEYGWVCPFQSLFSCMVDVGDWPFVMHSKEDALMHMIKHHQLRQPHSYMDDDAMTAELQRRLDVMQAKAAKLSEKLVEAQSDEEQQELKERIDMTNKMSLACPFYPYGCEESTFQDVFQIVCHVTAGQEYGGHGNKAPRMSTRNCLRLIENCADTAEMDGCTWCDRKMPKKSFNRLTTHLEEYHLVPPGLSHGFGYLMAEMYQCDKDRRAAEEAALAAKRAKGQFSANKTKNNSANGDMIDMQELYDNMAKTTLQL